jgi:hypothetical protein
LLASTNADIRWLKAFVTSFAFSPTATRTNKLTSRDNLIERRKSAEASAAAHREKARKLASDAADDATLSAAESAMRREQDRAATLGDALGDVETTIGNLEREIVQIIDQRCRAEAAAAVTALADKWATAGAAFDATVGELAVLARESATIVLDAHPLKVFLEAVKQQVPPEAGLVTNVLRDHAKAVLAGTAPASLPKRAAQGARTSARSNPSAAHRAGHGERPARICRFPSH